MFQINFNSSQSGMVCLFYHNVNFGLPFLYYKSSPESQAFITVVILQGFPQTCHQTVPSGSSAGLHLDDLLHIKNTALNIAKPLNPFTLAIIAT